jgi:hypothetical protein
MLCYPPLRIGRFGVSYGLTPKLLYERYGLDHGERFHRDIAWRVAQVMEIDRLVHRDFSGIGIGFAEPFARATIEPFGHRFVPAMYGCETRYAAAEDPSGVRLAFDPGLIRGHLPWTRERFEAAPPVRIVLEQASWARAHCDREHAERMLGYNPHAQTLSSLQNLGSVINTAVSVFGEDALLLGLDEPDLLRGFYAGVTDLMLQCLEYFPGVDGRRLRTVFVGNCTVAMISPAQYAALNMTEDLRLARYAASIDARFLVHQDSGANPHLAAYASLPGVGAIDFGQDTDWAAAAKLFPEADASCIIFPGWLRDRALEDIREELERLLRAGSAFPSFSFTLLEVDDELARGKVFEFHEAFRKAAEAVEAAG